MEMDVEWGGVSYSIEVPEGAGPGREITVQLPSLDEPLGGGSGVYGVADGKAPSCNMPHNPTCSVSQFAPPMEPSTHSRKFAERSCFNDGFTTSKDVLRDKPGHLSLCEAAADHGHAANADLINLLRSLGQQPRSSEARNEPGAAAVLPVEPSEPLDRPGGRGAEGASGAASRSSCARCWRSQACPGTVCSSSTSRRRRRSRRRCRNRRPS